MACLTLNSAAGSILHICGIHPVYRLVTLDGRYVYLDWHYYLGPTVYRDKRCNRVIDDWWKDDYIIRAVEWFQQRGEKA